MISTRISPRVTTVFNLRPSASAGIAKVLFAIFLVLFLVSLLFQATGA